MGVNNVVSNWRMSLWRCFTSSAGGQAACTVEDEMELAAGRVTPTTGLSGKRSLCYPK